MYRAFRIINNQYGRYVVYIYIYMMCPYKMPMNWRLPKPEIVRTCVTLATVYILLHISIYTQIRKQLELLQVKSKVFNIK